jgi:hypothetical protein
MVLKMLIKIINDENLEMHIEKLKNHFHVGTASKAVAHAAAEFLDSNETIYKQSQKIQQLQNKLDGILSVFAKKHEIENDISRFLAQEKEI